MEQVNLNGKKTHAFSSTGELIQFIREKKKILIAINTEKILNEDPRLTEIINDNIGYPDGVGAVLALKRKGIRAVKIRGAELWLEIVRSFYMKRSFYLLGSTNDIINATVRKLFIEFPRIEIRGFHDGYFDGSKLEEIKNDIREKKPDIVFVALGSPKQEYLMADLIPEHEALYMGLGGSFDLYCGKTKSVPEWWNRYLIWEGLYRALNDFTNVQRWRRQLPATRILYKILFDRL